jgi:phage tail-like protein
MPDRHGPMKTGRFTVAVDGVEVPGFRAVDLPRRYTETDNGRGDDDTALWGQTEYDDLTMERGVAAKDTAVLDWRRAVEAGRADDGRKTVTVSVQDEEGTTQLRWEFRNAWPKEYDPPTLDATASDGIATESFSLAFGEMERTK